MMKDKKLVIGRLALAVILLLFLSFVLEAKPKDNRGMKSFSKATAVQSTRTMINIGNWSYWMIWDGQSGRDPITGDSGGLYPRGTVSTIFADGFIWGGIVDDPSSAFPLRVGGSTYQSGSVAGYIDDNGNRVDPDTDTRVRIYRIRADWESLTPSLVTRDAAELNAVAPGAVTEAQQLAVLDQYEADWNEWPIDLGAPFNDLNQNGVYEPEQGETPGIANADQVVWSVMNDLDAGAVNDFVGSPSMGLEYQTIGWAYNQPGASLGQIVFKLNRIENASRFRIDSMYVCQWSDPDLGSYGDDVVGNDSLLSLGFVYNSQATDGAYSGIGRPPAAAGYDFFQGPLVAGEAGKDLNLNGIDDASDFGIFNLQVVGPGFVNLPMTSFSFFAAGSNPGDPPLHEYDGTRGWYNLLRGFLPDFDVDNPTPYVHLDGALAGRVTKFPLNGDPFEGLVNGNTDLDIDNRGGNLSASDRRFLLSTGPFVLDVGDVQEIVIALIGGEGSTDVNDPIAYIKAVNTVKTTDLVAQQLFDDLFQTVPKPPTQPNVTAVPFRESIVLEWGSDQATVASTEANNAATGYNFEGYNVYQLPTATSALSEGIKVATFDIPNGVTIIKGKRLLNETGTVETVTVQAGSDNGVQRHFTVDRNFLTGEGLFPGSAYHFAVTAYNYNDFSVVAPLIEDSTLESGANILTVAPQDPRPGVRYAETGSTLAVDGSGATSDGIVQATIIDPTSLIDGSYQVTFAEDTDSNSATFGELLWSVTRNGTVVVANQRQAVNLDERNDQPIFDGLQVKVTGPKFDFKAFETVANANGRLDPPDGAAADFQGFPSLRPGDAQQATAGGHWMIHTSDNGARAAYGDPDNPAGDNYLGRSTRNGGNWPEIIPYDFEWRWDSNAPTMPGWDVFGSGAFIEVPFTIWNIGIGTPDDPSDDYQMYGIIIDNNGDGSWNYDGADHTGSSATNDPQTDWLYFYNPTGHTFEEAPGTAAYDAIVDSIRAGTWTGFVGTETIARQVLFNWNGGDVNDPTFPANTNQLLPEDGTIFRYTTNKPNTVSDVFAFSTTAPSESRALAEQDVENINVFPNPYYAFNPEEPDRFNRFVTFSHLPETATLRIFNLAGIQVRKLDKDSQSQFLQWDLRNEDNLPVASGIYIVHIDMPVLSMEKVLKVYIIQGEEILRFF